MDEVFRALADPTRRGLLDELFREDGQTLSALECRLPMTRFGVMKHLKVLEEAGLVTTKRRGREKLHFLNPVPIRLVHDRWVSKYAEPWAATLSELKSTNRGANAHGEGIRDLHQDHAERLWEAITDPEHARPVHLRRSASAPTGRRARATSRSTPTDRRPDLRAGENLEVEPPRRLVQSFTALWSDEVEQRRDLPGHLGDRAGRGLLPADSSPTTSCQRAPTPNSTAAGR